MKEKINLIEKELNEKLNSVKSLQELDAIIVEFLGKTGKITLLFSDMRNVPNEEKKEAGQFINACKIKAEEIFKQAKLKFEEEELNKEIGKAKQYDASLPPKTNIGSLHPITIVQKEIVDIFKEMGFVVEDGNEIETEFNNFDAVNVPKNHPARDMQDTFWLDNGEVLKTHTSAAQNRILKKHGGDVKAIFPGRCYRNEDVDASHDKVFFQLEGMMCGENISIANLVYFMKAMLSKVLGRSLDVRLRPGYFPFVEPGFEMDISCPFCEGNGCKTCKNGGWIELCPCGMIHPRVFELAGLDPNKVSGFAFGLGLTRLAMIKYDIKEIRLLNSGNLNFLKQVGIANGKEAK